MHWWHRVSDRQSGQAEGDQSRNLGLADNSSSRSRLKEGEGTCIGERGGRQPPATLSPRNNFSWRGLGACPRPVPGLAQANWQLAVAWPAGGGGNEGVREGVREREREESLGNSGPSTRT
jgi:hypothetical protein